MIAFILHPSAVSCKLSVSLVSLSKVHYGNDAFLSAYKALPPTHPQYNNLSKMKAKQNDDTYLSSIQSTAFNLSSTDIGRLQNAYNISQAMKTKTNFPVPGAWNKYVDTVCLLLEKNQDMKFVLHHAAQALDARRVPIKKEVIQYLVNNIADSEKDPIGPITTTKESLTLLAQLAYRLLSTKSHFQTNNRQVVITCLFAAYDDERRGEDKDQALVSQHHNFQHSHTPHL